MIATDTKFAGSIPALYDQYLTPLLFAPYAADLVDRMAALWPQDILETAAGTGIVTRAIADALPEARIVATDLNQDMLDQAARRVASRRIMFATADAQALPFPEASFDLVVCQFGVMFFPDRAAAYREALRVLRPGGHFLFNVWDRLDRNPLSFMTSAALSELFPEDPPRFLERVPFGYNDPGKLRADVGMAGFDQVRIETVSKRSRAPSARDGVIGLCQGSPLRAEILDRGCIDRATDAAAAALSRHEGPSGIDLAMSALVVTARKPK